MEQVFIDKDNNYFFWINELDRWKRVLLEEFEKERDLLLIEYKNSNLRYDMVREINIYFLPDILVPPDSTPHIIIDPAWAKIATHHKRYIDKKVIGIVMGTTRWNELVIGMFKILIDLISAIECDFMGTDKIKITGSEIDCECKSYAILRTSIRISPTEFYEDDEIIEVPRMRPLPLPQNRGFLENIKRLFY